MLLFFNNLFILLQSKQHSAGFAGSAEGVPDNSGNLQMRSRVSAKTRTGLQLRPQGMFTAIFIQGSVTTVSCIPCLLNCRNYCATGIYTWRLLLISNIRVFFQHFIFREGSIVPLSNCVKQKGECYKKFRSIRENFSI